MYVINPVIQLFVFYYLIILLLMLPLYYLRMIRIPYYIRFTFALRPTHNKRMRFNPPNQRKMPENIYFYILML